MKNPIELTERAKNYLLNSCISAQKSAIKLQVKGGGCAGFSYEYTFEEVVNDFDEIVHLDDKHSFVLDSLSLMYVLGTIVDYEYLGGDSYRATRRRSIVADGNGGTYKTAWIENPEYVKPGSRWEESERTESATGTTVTETNKFTGETRTKFYPKSVTPPPAGGGGGGGGGGGTSTGIS